MVTDTLKKCVITVLYLTLSIINALKSPPCGTMFRCAAEAEADNLMAKDQDNYCSSLRETNICMNDNIDNCLIAKDFKAVIDESRDKEEEDCTSGAKCFQATYLQVLLAVIFVILFYCGKA